MSSLEETNFIKIGGTLQKDLMIQLSAKNFPYARFTLINTIEIRKTKSMQYVECVTFGTLAEEMSRERFVAGHPLVIEGKLQMGNYVDKNGVTHKSVSVIVTNFRRPEENPHLPDYEPDVL